MSGRILLYGATGFTGREIARALAGTLDIVLAGRDAQKLRAVADPLGLPWLAFDLSDPVALAAALQDVNVVLHAAGPFETTACPMIDGCLRTGTHYLDLGGEWPVFLEAMEYDAAAKSAGIMIVPGVGLTVAASDCLLALAKERWPDTVRFCLGISRAQVISRGSVESAARLLSPEVIIRRKGALVTVPAGSLVRAFDFGNGFSEAVAMSWADVVTGTITTGVGDIEVYSEMRWPERAGYRASSMAMEVAGVKPWRQFGGALAKVWPDGPSESARDAASFSMVVEALDPWRRVRRLKARTMNGYDFSVVTAAEAVRRMLSGTTKTGFQTPALAFGASFIFDVGAAVVEARVRTSGSMAA
tara:strand:+ start:493 stop:1569 length:1077 start_codon:yes stop_codon:yes gene_type:complete